MNASDLALFALGSAVIVWLSRKPLRHPGSHGFYRFFAWEAILILVVLNRSPWGEQPFSPHQSVSWVLMLTSIALVILGHRALKQQGHASEARADGDLYGFEKTTTVVSTGIFAYIRHPMYASLLALTWGAWFQAPSIVGIIVAATGSFFLLLTALADERECQAFFGEPYKAYMARSKRFIPFIF
jgi:protein-S-isoprenylcysteine O-methyltransferase Ste14